ncbi:cd7 antigen-like [Amia ocellicauda]|uniref:cd7 antigen-like n=1 Tax=Amia ocellicauda TaxID=2972642 RepID=UPI003463D17B
MRGFHSMFWMSFVAALVFEPSVFSAPRDVVYLESREGGSVVLHFVSQNGNDSPTGFYLRRKHPGPVFEMLFLDADTADSTVESWYSGRLKIAGKLSSNKLNVTISDLRHNDSGLYVCDFLYEAVTHYRNVSGKNDFVVFVKRTENLRCSSYPTLLFSISGAVGLLLVIVVVLCTIQCTKLWCKAKPKANDVVYEDMGRLQPAGKRIPHGFAELSHLEEKETSAPLNNTYESHYNNLITGTPSL